jgi:hypothetical protein
MGPGFRRDDEEEMQTKFGDTSLAKQSISNRVEPLTHPRKARPGGRPSANRLRLACASPSLLNPLPEWSRNGVRGKGEGAAPRRNLSMIVGEQTYESTDPTIDSQICPCRLPAPTRSYVLA